MGSRYEVEITITSAKDLKNVNWRHDKLNPYAVVWVDPNSKFSTHVDEEGDTCPHWDEKLTIPFNSPIENSTLYIDIVHANANEGTKPLIGSARLRLRDVVDDVGLGSLADKKLELKRPSGRPQGHVELKVIVREPRYAPPYSAPPVYAAPPYSAPPVYAAPPVGYPSYGQPGYDYGQPGYGYGQVGGYGYVGEEKKSKFGGMGTGLAVGAVAGVLGGVALAEGVDALEDKIEDDVVEDDVGYDGDDY